MGRPKAKIDVIELEKLCGMQCTDEEVAAWFSVCTKTIERLRQRKQFREIMDRARAKGRVSVRRNLFRQAGNNNIAATIFLAKNVLGYRDVVSNEHSGPDGSPVATSIRLVVMEAGQRIEEKPKPVSVSATVRTI
ncbi:MAG: hypothetical protein WA758_11320 [Candidatus Acidiferrales bacterium]